MSLRVDEPSEAPPHSRRAYLVAVTLLVMGLSAGGIWAAWRIVGHHAADGAVPVIHADERPVKVPPVNPGGLSVPDENLYVLNGDRPRDSKIEQLLPPPEQPLPRPAPPTPTITDAAPAAPATPPAGTPPATAASGGPPPAAAAVAPSGPPAAAPAPAATVASAAVMPAKPAAGGFRLQIGALRNEDAAQAELARLKRANTDILGPLEIRILRADLGDRGIFFRLEAGPIAEEAAAVKACDALKERKVGCILVRP